MVTMKTSQMPEIETRLFINNEFVPGTTESTFPLFDPLTGQEFCQVHEALEADVDAAVRAAAAAFPAWKATAASERARLLFKLVDLIRRDAQELAALDAKCMGKPLSLVHANDVNGCCGIFTYYAGCAYHLLGETSLSEPPYLNISVRQPYGVCGLIIPWNVPQVMFAFKVAPALITGNTVVLKSSEKAPLSALKLAALIKEAGFPAGVVNVISGFGNPTGSALSLHMQVRKISFTGSVATGKRILHAAADSNLKNVSLELGGKNPALIFPDADLDEAARYTHYSVAHNSGQHCQAITRALVHVSVAQDFIARLKTLFEKTVLGDPFEEETFQGPQADILQVERIEKLVNAGAKDGKLLTGGKRGASGAFFEPTILLDVPQSSMAYQEEIFGPVIIVNTFTTEAEGITEANNTELGLFAAVFTKDFERALRVALAFEAGIIGVNSAVPLRSPDMPVGGWKQSGVGRELGLHGLNMYTELKAIFLRYGHDGKALANRWHNTHHLANGQTNGH